MLIGEIEDITTLLRKSLNAHYVEMRDLLENPESTHQDLEVSLNKLISIANLLKHEIEDLTQYESD